MRRLRYILLILCSLMLLLTMLSAILLAVLDDDDYRGMLTWGVERLTDYRMTINGKLSLEFSMTPSLTAEEVRIEPDGRDEMPLSADFGSFSIRVDLKPLLSGVILIKELHAEDAVIVFSNSGAPEERSAWKKINDIDLPVIEMIALKNIRLSYSDKVRDLLLDLNLRSFTVDDQPGSGLIHIKGEGDLNNAGFAVEGSLGSITDALDPSDPFPIELGLNISGFSFMFSGTVDDPVEGEGLDIALSVEGAELSDIPKIIGMDIPGLGRMDLDARLTGSIEAPVISEFNMTVSRGDELSFSAEGVIANLRNGEGTDIAISGASSSSPLLKALFPEPLHDLTGVVFEGGLYSDDGYLTIKDAVISASNEKGTRIKMRGSLVIGWPEKALEVTAADLMLELTAADTAPLKPFLFDRLPDTGPLDGRARLLLKDKGLSLDGIDVTAGRPEGVLIKAEGSIGSVPLGSDSSVSGVDIYLKIESGRPEQLFSGFDISMPELASLSARGRIRGSGDDLSFDGLDIRMTDPDRVTAVFTGSADLERREDEEFLWNYALDTSMTAENIRSFRGLLLATALPDLGPVNAAAHITGTNIKMSIKDIVIRAGYPGPVRFELSGNIGKVLFGQEQPLSDVDITGSFYAEKTSSLSKYLGLPIPDIGPIEHRWRIVKREGGYGADDVEYMIGSKDEYRLRATGSTEYVMRGNTPVLEGIDLAVEINDMEWDAILGLLGQDIPGLGSLSGTLSLSGSPGDLAVSDADLHSASPEGLEVSLRGGIEQIRAKSSKPLDGVDLEISVRVTEASLIGLPLKREIPLTGRLEIYARLMMNKDEADMDGEIRIGETQFLISLKKATVDQRPGIVARVSSPKVYLADIGIYPEVPQDSGLQAAEEVSGEKRIFGDEPLPLDLLKNKDISLSLDVEEMIGRDILLRDLDIDLSLVNGLLRIGPAKLTYADGFVSVDSTIDVRGPKPEFFLKMTGEDIDVGALLSHVHMPLILGGHLNLAVDLKGAGGSPREIASSLTGELGVTIENGRIKNAADLMGADAVDLLTTARSLGSYNQLNCLAVGFSFYEGRGSSRVIYIDTPSVRSRGAGSLDLSGESIEITIKPEPKKGQVGGSSPVYIQGTLGSPIVKKIPFKEAARLSGEILAPYVFLPARALGYVWYLMKDDKDEASPCLLQEPLE